MPISTRIPIRRVSQDEFGEIAFDVLRHVFEIHNQIGRFFDETIYKRELEFRMPGVRVEEPIEVVFGSFRKRYQVDVLVREGAIFEFKAVESLARRHRAQLLHYLLLCDAEHGKLINVRPESVEHEFVNTSWTLADRTRFEICREQWDDSTEASSLPELLVPLLRDVGAGLELGLYEQAALHHFGVDQHPETEVAVVVDGRQVGRQRFRLIAPGVALKVTGFDEIPNEFESHARRLLRHVDLKAIAWVNVSMRKVTFTTLKR